MALASTLEPPQFDFEILSPDCHTSRHLGSYVSAEVGYFWNVPGTVKLRIQPDHPMAGYLINCRYRVIHVRTWRNGEPWDGRVFTADVEGKPGQETIDIYCIGNLFWLLRTLVWVNSLFPLEVQVGLTGKQDIMIGNYDFVFKYFGAKQWIRQNKPVYCALPVRYEVELPNIADLLDLDELLEFIADSDFVALTARFPYLDELIRQTVNNKEIGLSCHLWTANDGASPEVFNTQTLANLQSLLNIFEPDNYLRFLNEGNPLGLNDPSDWGKITKHAGYVFETHEKRDRKHFEWRTDSGQIDYYKRHVEHLSGHQAVVGGKSPDFINRGIEWGANLAIQVIAGLITTALGLPGVGGVVVGDLFDNIFFAYQGFENTEILETDGGGENGEHFFCEVFGDNTAAWSLDSAAVGFEALKKASGDDSVTISVRAGGPDGEGLQFGADDGVHRRYRHGDIMTFWDRGTRVENYVASVVVKDYRDGHMVEDITFGDNSKLRDSWYQVINQFSNFAQFTRGVANSI